MTNLNIDQQELNKFAEQAAHWWDTAGEMRALHKINPLRLQFIQSIIKLDGLSILDVGCGGGILSESLAVAGANVTGIDMHDEIIQVATLHQLETGTTVEYLKITVEELAAQRPQQYDVVTCLEMLEHVPNPASVIKACAKLLKPQGHLFVSTLNRNLKSYLFAIIGAEYILKLLPRNTHDYAKFIKPSELCRWLRDENFEPLATKGIEYHPLQRTFFLSDNISVNYLLHAKKP